jgi:Tol biopolymer transport system component
MKKSRIFVNTYFFSILWAGAIGFALTFAPLLGGCAKKGTESEDDAKPAVGVWQDTATGRTFYFDDSTWWSGLNRGTYSGENEGTLYLWGQEYAEFKISGGTLTVTELLDNGDTYVLTQQTDEAPVYVYVSDLTRRGNFIAFASDRGGHPEGDIFIYTVDSNAYLDTVFYYDLEIEIVVNNNDTTYDTTLIKRFIEPVRALTDRAGMDVMPSWSPDGMKLAFVSDRSGYQAVWICFLDNFGAPVPVSDSIPANPVQLTAPTREMNDANPTWSPDGITIAFERRDLDGSADNLRDIYMIPSDAYGDESQVRNFTASPTYDCFNPEWSSRSDVDKILFEERQNGTSSDWDVYWMDGSDSEGFDPGDRSKKVTNPNRNGHPTWAPDCRMVAFERNPPGSEDQYDIRIQSFALEPDTIVDMIIDPTTGDTSYVTRVDTAININPQSLTTQDSLPGLNRYPTWLPNGNLIAFMRENDIWLIDISSGIDNPRYRRLLEDDYQNWDIAW